MLSVERPYNLLLVDDDEHIINFLEEIIKVRYGGIFNLMTTKNSADVPRILNQVDFHLAIVDLHMPSMGGDELLEIIKEEKPNLFVIMLTGDNTYSALMRSYAGGAYDYILKPLTPQSIYLVLDRLLSVLDNWKDFFHNYKR